MKQDIRVHDQHVVVQFGPSEPQGRHAASLILLIHQIANLNSAAAGPYRGADHVLLVADHDDRLLDAHARERFQIPEQQRASSQLDQTLGMVLRDGPEPFPDTGCKENRFHERTAAVSSTCWKAARKPSISPSVNAPIFATRKILLSS